MVHNTTITFYCLRNTTLLNGQVFVKLIISNKTFSNKAQVFRFFFTIFFKGSTLILCQTCMKIKRAKLISVKVLGTTRMYRSLIIWIKFNSLIGKLILKFHNYHSLAFRFCCLNCIQLGSNLIFTHNRPETRWWPRVRERDK